MNNKKIRLAIAVGVALLVHILASLFFLCLNTPIKSITAENIAAIEIFNAAEQVQSTENISNLPVATTSATANNSYTDRRAHTLSSDTMSDIAAPAANTATVASRQPGSNQSQPSTTAVTGGRQGVPVVMPHLRSSIQPNYPLQAKNAGIQGQVLLRILVNTQGVVEQVSIAASSGNTGLDDAARQAVWSWTFSPAKDEHGQLVNCYIRIPIKFNLKNER